MILFSKLLDNPHSTIEPLVILHGFLGSHQNWLSVAKKLQHHFPIILLDLRNHGDSPWANSMQLSDVVLDIMETIGTYNVQTVNLLGHSYGGKVAIAFLNRFPQVVKKLILVDVALRSYEELKNNFFTFINRINEIPLKNFSTYTQLKHFLKLQNFSEEEIMLISKSVKNTPKGFKWKVNIDCFLMCIDDLFFYEEPLKADLYVLLLWGEKSHFLNDNDIITYKKFFKNFTYVKVKGAGHWLNFEKTDLISNVVAQFICR